MAEFRAISEKRAKEFGKDYVKILTRFLLSNKPYAKKATGALINSLNYKVQQDAREIEIFIISNDYLKYVDMGRRPGTYPPIRPLLKWASVKGLPVGMAYAVQKNIYKFGIKPTKVIQKTVREITTSPTLKRKYEQEGVENIVKLVNKNFKYI